MYAPRLEPQAPKRRDAKAARGRLQELLSEVRSEAETLRAQLIEARDEITGLLARNDRLRGLTETRLPDGTHVVRIVAVGESQVPPRLVVMDAYRAPWHAIATVPARRS
jgi:hypothetical protein